MASAQPTMYATSYSPMKIKTIGVLCTLVATVSLGVNQSNAIELVVNGGFETGSLTGWALTPNTIPFGTTPGVQMSGVSHSGDWAVALGNYPTVGFLTQSIATTAGTTYDISFWLQLRNQSGLSPDFNNFSLSFGSTTLPGGFTNNQSPFGYTKFAFTGITATSASTALQFSFSEKLGYMALDDVSVQLSTGGAPANGVPDGGSSAALFGVVALGMGAFARFSRKH